MSRLARGVGLGLIIALLLVAPIGCWIGPLGGVVCVPAPSGSASAPGKWLLTSHAGEEVTLLVLKKSGDARAVALDDSAVFFESLRVRTLPWGVDGGVLFVGSHQHAAADWSVSSKELTLGDSTHRDWFRRQWCVGE